MKVAQVVIKDLEKLMIKAGIKEYSTLARLANVNYIYLINSKNGKHIVSENTWNKLTKVLIPQI